MKNPPLIRIPFSNRTYYPRFPRWTSALLSSGTYDCRCLLQRLTFVEGNISTWITATELMVVRESLWADKSKKNDG